MSEEMVRLYNERVQMFKDVTEHKPTKKVPVFAMSDTWCLPYYGTTMSEALKDPKLEHAAYVKGICDFDYDASCFVGISTPMNFAYSLGGGMYSKDQEHIQIQTGISENMSSEEYDQLIEDPYNFIQNTILERKFSLFRTKSSAAMFFKLTKSLISLGVWAGNKNKAMEDFKQNYGMPVLNDFPAMVSTDIIFDGLRDFKGISMDIRRCPEKVAAASMALTDEICIPSIQYACGEPRDDAYPQIYTHLPPWISPKQFEQIYWPSFKKYTDAFHDRGYKMVIFFEKNWSRLYGFIRDLQKDFIIACFEDDDPVTAKREVGDVVTFCGGLPTDVLKYGTPESCVEYTKKVFDDMAPGGSFIFSPNKVLLSENDAMPENLKAVTSFAKEYGKY